MKKLTPEQVLRKKERFKPKLEHLRGLLIRGVIPYTIWNFKGKQSCQKCRRKVAITYPHSSGLNICCECWGRVVSSPQVQTPKGITLMIRRR